MVKAIAADPRRSIRKLSPPPQVVLGGRTGAKVGVGRKGPEFRPEELGRESASRLNRAMDGRAIACVQLIRSIDCNFPLFTS